MIRLSFAVVTAVAALTAVTLLFSAATATVAAAPTAAAPCAAAPATSAARLHLDEFQWG
ncbi:hypothetical protein [Streptomyces sp. NPDC001828]|uniref:hypothetical protein n=1 Tax=Streptomyces sp. NPDC001828 TaxID=3364615 RepID=UPI00368BDD6A